MRVKHDESKATVKEEVAMYFKILSQVTPEGREENHERCLSDRPGKKERNKQTNKQTKGKDARSCR
jgi:hypothetical protein